MAPFQKLFPWSRLPTKMATKLKIEKRGWNLKKIFSEITEPISTKPCWNDPWVVPFQNCVRHSRPPTKMSATAELSLTKDPMGNSNTNLLRNHRPIATNLCWNDLWMTPFLLYVRWSRLPTKIATKLKIEKGGMNFKKKNSSLKLLSQSQPNFAEMVLGWSPSKLCLAFETSGQDGRHSRN